MRVGQRTLGGPNSTTTEEAYHLRRMPNKRDRELRRLRDAREANTAIPESVLSEQRRPMIGFEDRYEITRSGHVWSLRLGRFIKHQYHPITKRTYISITVNGKHETRGVWRAVVDSWVPAHEHESILARLPRELHGQLALLREKNEEIAAIAGAYDLPTQAVFAIFLSADACGAA